MPHGVPAKSNDSTSAAATTSTEEWAKSATIERETTPADGVDLIERARLTVDEAKAQSGDIGLPTCVPVPPCRTATLVVVIVYLTLLLEYHYATGTLRSCEPSSHGESTCKWYVISARAPPSTRTNARG
jgi:hypothetical protein